MRKFLFLIALIFFCEIILYSQKYPFYEYTVADGMPQSSSIGFFQDSRGFIWINTHNGLSMFDGVEFRNFFKKDGLTENFILVVQETADKKIYAIANNGISIFDGRHFIPYYCKDTIHISAATATEIDGKLIMVYDDRRRSKNGFLAFSKGSYEVFSDKNPELSKLDPDNIVYSRESGELFIKDNKGKFYAWKKGTLRSVSAKRHDKAVREGSGNIPEGKELLYLPGNGKTLRIGLPVNTPSSVSVDSENNIWVLGENNMYRLISTAFTQLPANSLLTEIWTIAEDRKKHLWFGSLYGDLVEYDGTALKVRNEYKKLFRAKTGFYKGSRMMSNGDIYFSVNCGVLIWNGRTFSRLEGIPETAQVCYIYEDPVDKSVLIGTGIGLYHLIHGKMRYYPEFNDDSLGVPEGIIREAEGKYWISGQRGLAFLDNGKGTKIHDKMLPQAFTFVLERDSLGGLWITSEEGLYHRDFSGKTSQGLPERINSPANSIYRINNSTLLVGRTTDICIIDIKKFYGGDPEYYRIYNKSNGFSGYDCLDNGIIRDSKGQILILTSNTVDILDYSLLKTNPYPPKINFTDIETDDETFGWVSVSPPGMFYGESGTVNLNYRQNDVRFSYTGISTTSPGEVMYQHRLLGYKDKWSEKTKERKAVYENLSPGTYRFELMSYNADGIVEIKSCPVEIYIKPAIWQRLAFRILFFIFVFGSTIWGTWVMVRRFQKEKMQHQKMEMELSQLHLGSAIKQFDPHFTFNVISSVGSLIMTGDKEMAYEYLLKLSGLLRSILSDGGAIIRPLSEELDFVKKYCEVQKLRMGDRINWSIKVSPGVNMNIAIPKLTIQIFVENAIKHGFENRKEGGRVSIELKNENGLLVTVTDNGIGRKAAGKNKNGTGNGIQIIEKIFDHYNRKNREKAMVSITDLYYNDGTAAGTEVNIRLPENYNFELSEKFQI
ncbi:MAG TPA: histidine kinase [Bacteroidales bacterium]|nr:histidine kinase [Bacteroidales bacterium]